MPNRTKRARRDVNLHGERYGKITVLPRRVRFPGGHMLPWAKSLKAAMFFVILP